MGQTCRDCVCQPTCMGFHTLDAKVSEATRILFDKDPMLEMFERKEGEMRSKLYEAINQIAQASCNFFHAKD